MTDLTSYDRVPYPATAFPQTHPAAIEVLAHLRGMDPAPVERCRVLELGCGSAGNLIPMAYQYPDSTFVGVDLSRTAIKAGERAAADLGLWNLGLSHMDIMDLPDLGSFDYIIAHGVYSWVPPPVRERMMEIFSRHLAPQGVAYVSYNCKPRSHVRDIARDIMLFHTRAMTDPAERVEQARGALRFIAEATDPSDIYGFTLRDLSRSLDEREAEVVYHDDLNPNSTPFLFVDVMEVATRNGLQFLCEAASSPKLEGHLEPMNAFLDRIPDSSIVVREQYFDFFVGRGFRSTLLCHAAVDLQHRVDPLAIRPYRIVGRLEPEGGEFDPAGREAVQFTASGKRALATDHRLSKAAILHLSEIWPGAADLDELLAAALARLGPGAADIEANLADETEALAGVLYRAFAAGALALRRTPPPLASRVGERPEASLLARRQAASGTRVTNLLHGAVALDDPTVRRFVQLLDGTRTIDDLVADLQGGLAADAHNPERGESPVITREDVERNLQAVLRLGLLVA
jgi:SAM-dependent methyltransferase